MTQPSLTPRTLEDLIPGDIVRWLHVHDTMSFLHMTAGYVEKSLSGYTREYEKWRETLKTTPTSRRPCAGMTDTDIDSFLEPDLSFLTREFPRHLRHSIIIAAYSALERHFDFLAETASRAQGIPLQYAGRGNRLAQARAFMRHAAIRVNMPAPLWKDVQALRRLRNRIVHEDAGPFRGSVAGVDAAECERVLTTVERCLTALYDAHPRPKASSESAAAAEQQA